MPLDMATIDHLDTRLSPLRGLWQGRVARTVLACNKCNHARGSDQKALEMAGLIGR